MLVVELDLVVRVRNWWMIGGEGLEGELKMGSDGSGEVAKFEV
jgi:hypothetical protein